MRILKLRLANLNSLTGEWEVDFTHPDYANEGLFAITGPTGAGKSTILDAICLALYGQTPRLGKITKTDNDIMSRQFGSCWAEVSFATEQGQYRAFWYQHKARKAADGALQNARHELSVLESGQIIEEKLSLVPAKVAELSGLDFDRFTRSVLLAQGQFAAFLHADDSQRSALLEQLTGTDIYAQISKMVYQRNKDEKERLAQLKARLGDITLLTDDERRALDTQLVQLQAEVQKAERALEQCQEAARWVARLQQLNDEQHQLAAKEQQLSEDRAAFTPKQDALHADADVRPLASDLRQHGQLEQELEATRARYAQTDQQHQQLIGQLEQLESSFKHAQQAFASAKDERAQAEPQLEVAVQLDQQLQFLAQRDHEMTAERAGYQREVEALNQQITTLQAQLSEAQPQLAELEAWLQQHNYAANLAEVIAQIEVHNEQYQHLLQQAETQETKRQELRTQYQAIASRPSSDQHERQHAQVSKHRSELVERRVAAQQQLEHLRLVQRFAQQRDLLTAGQPCPLCGANDHPFAEDVDDNTDLAPQIDAAERHLQSLDGDIGDCERQLQALEVQQAISAQEQRMRMDDIKKQGEQCAATIRDNQVQAETIVARWQSWYERYPPQRDCSSQPVDESQRLTLLIQTLRAAHQTYVRNQDGCEQLRRRIDQLQHQLGDSTRQLQRQQRDNERLEAQQRELAEQLDEQKQARQALFDGKPTKVVKQSLNNAMEHAERNLAQATEQRQQCKDKALTEANSLTHLEQRKTALETQLSQLTEHLNGRMQALNVADLAAMKAALLDESVYRTYQSESDALVERKRDLEAKRRAWQEQHDHAVAHQPSDAAENSQQMDTLREQVSSLHQSQGALKEQLREDSEASSKHAALQAEIEAQQRIQHDWSTLNDMIGSQDGKNYRNFAQGLTFAVMIDYANQKLRKMSDRYLLLHDHRQGLSLQVMDDYQGGEVRSTKNLSGGESFIVSLALALGLAQMASSRVRVDSLFLDEGFGTLDPQTLEVALDTLASLRQEGKMIGLISHVGALQDRIATQLAVTPGPSGQSTLTGPGVRRGSDV